MNATIASYRGQRHENSGSVLRSSERSRNDNVGPQVITLLDNPLKIFFCFFFGQEEDTRGHREPPKSSSSIQEVLEQGNVGLAIGQLQRFVCVAGS